MKSFQIYVAVPEYMIKHIGLEIKELLLQELDSMPNDVVYKIGQSMNKVIDVYSAMYDKTYDGFLLQTEDVYDISTLLKDGRKIDAIKLFRSKTSAGLREAKDLIVKFGATELGAEKFIKAFIQ